MPLTIAATAAVAAVLGGYAWPVALLLGAMLAPTAPVLASSVEVGPPGAGEEGEIRFGLTAEAGLNDGLAFPFVALALVLVEGGSADVGWWAGTFAWKPLLSVALGALLGRGAGWLAFHAPVPRLSSADDGIRSLGTLYYLLFSTGGHPLPQQDRVRALVGFVVLASIVLHGAAAGPLMRWADRRRAEMSERPLA